jgi:protein SCO1/2
MTVATLKKLGRALRNDGQNARFILVSLTPDRDTSAALAEYAKTHKLDPASWRLLTGNEDGLKEITAVLDVKYRRDAAGIVAHTGGIFAVDGKGIVVAKDLTGQDAAQASRALVTARSAPVQ